VKNILHFCGGNRTPINGEGGYEAKVAMTELQQQIEAVRRDAFAAGYAAAMRSILDVASRSAPKTRITAGAPNRRGRGRARQAEPAAQPATRRRTRATGVSASTRRSVAGPAQRGANALMIDEILTAVAPRAVRPAEIRKALQDKGVGISFASIRHALGQLEARNAAEQVGDSKSWRHRGGTA
jgi:hypothetical protein